ncbi:O-antigen polymerase [Raphidiopsis brookii D9]|nr:O-antigen polymerase [Raphidiopsis brookii D9]
MLAANLKQIQQFFVHPHSSLQLPWNSLLLGLLILPINPFFGAIAIGWASYKTWRKKYSSIQRKTLNHLLVILSFWFLITTGFTVFARDQPDAFLGLFNFLPYFVVFAGLTPLITTVSELRQLTWIIVCSSLPVVMIGLGQLFLGWHARWQFLSVVVNLTIDPGGEPLVRMSSVFMNANTLAAYLITVLILGLGLWLENYHKIRKKANPLGFIFLSVVIIANFLALILTGSRNGWGIAVMACIAYALYQGWRLIIAGVIGLTTSIILASFATERIASVFRSFVPRFIWARLNSDTPLALMRKTQWQFAWDLTLQQPLSGWGLRSFPHLYEQKMGVSVNHPHNLFLMLSAETGLVTTCLFFGFFWLGY